MLNDRDDRDEHDDHEESEYHFSDEDSYEAGPETPKSVNAGVPHESVGSRLAKSKRMIISVGVFFVLVFIVYKLVSPTSNVPGEISTAIVAANPQAAAPKPKAPAPVQPAQPVQQQAAAQQVPQPMPPEAQPVAAQTPVMQVQVQPPAPTQVPAPVTAQAMQPQAMQPQAMQPQAPVPVPPPAAQPQTVVSMPSMIPVSPPPAPEAIPVSSTPTVTIVQSPAPPEVSGVDNKIAALEANNQKLLSQMQADYTQKLNDYSVQNKAMQDQLQTLSSRVAGMESQLNQLVQALTRSGQVAGPAPAPGSPTSMIDSNKQLPPIGQEIKVAFSVQAIIPGRAWLRSDNGEALTVAEGDTIKGFGRVTKIDPYDGVVEVNTGNRVVSLSYGNGAES